MHIYTLGSLPLAPNYEDDSMCSESRSHPWEITHGVDIAPRFGRLHLKSMHGTEYFAVYPMILFLMIAAPLSWSCGNIEMDGRRFS